MGAVSFPPFNRSAQQRYQTRVARAHANDIGNSYVKPEFLWDKLFDPFQEVGSDIFLVVTPGHNALYVADPEAVNQITSRRNDFPKPTEMYASLNIFGKNVVSTEGSIWRHQRKITSPPFTERNNHLVWVESLHQAQSMLSGWVTKDQTTSGTIWDLAAESMRLSLHVISRAGFGVRLQWPHEGADNPVPAGHTLTYKSALESLLVNIIVVMLTPKSILSRSPFKLHKVANESYVEWGKYMREMYHEKRKEVKEGETREGMDLMGALVTGAGITTEALNADDPQDDHKKSNKQLLTDEEILGNAFVFILAGHETAANTIHFAIMLLAMNITSQRRLQEDLDTIFGDRPISEWDYDEDVPKLFGTMCGAVMNEELRLIPPVCGIPKSTPKGQPQGLQTASGKYTVPENCHVTLDAAAIHRNPKYWPHASAEDLLEFRPERWLVDPTATATTARSHAEGNAYEEEAGLDFDGPDKRPDTAPSLFRPAKGAYIPFSDGYRSCLGRRFAQVEILAVLAVIFKTWSVELDVSMFLSDDEDLATVDEARKREAWNKADARARDLLRNGMVSIITIQMRKGKVPVRFVKRGHETFQAA